MTGRPLNDIDRHVAENVVTWARFDGDPWGETRHNVLHALGTCWIDLSPEDQAWITDLLGPKS